VSSGPETRFIASVHRHLPPADQFHREKMANPYRGGTADSWYSGKRDLWVEWKFIELPKRDTTMIDLTGGKNPPLSPLQQDWIRGRNREGRDVWVVIGCKEGGLILPGVRYWDAPFPTEYYRKRLLTRPEVAQRILQHCNA
jgi:hypothetical protein